MNTKPNTIDPAATAGAASPGWQTSEFWMAAVTSVIVLLNSAFGWHIDPSALATVAGMVAAYGLARMGTKRAVLTSGTTTSGTATATIKS